MNYSQLVTGMKRFGATERDICIQGIGVSPEQIRENVILAPWWEPSALPDLGSAEYLSSSPNASEKVWDIHSASGGITYIKTGIGAPSLMDAVLSLGVTKCKRVVFIGSAGALDEAIGIGDLVIPEYSVCGDGASRYIAADSLRNGDVFGEKAFPDAFLLGALRCAGEEICGENRVNCHLGRTFSIDTIFAQFAHIDEILRMGCNVIEMETAAAFRAAKLANLPIAALFSVSDNTLRKKSLVSGRTEQEHEYRKQVRGKLFPQIILKVFQESESPRPAAQTSTNAAQ